MALLLARPKHRLYSNPSLIHLFSTSSSSSDPPPQNGNESGDHSSQSPSSSSPSDFKTSSYFSSIRESLKQKPQNLSPSVSGKQFGGHFQDIRRNLNEFQRRATPPPPRDFQDLYKQNELSKSGDGIRKMEGSSLENLKANLRQMRPQGNTGTKLSNLASFQSIMKTKPIEEGLPISVFGKEMEEEKKKIGDETEFIKRYDTGELGEKLRLYRPQGKKEEGWFSLQELNQRLVKLREMEEEEIMRKGVGKQFMDLRSNLQKTKLEEAEKSLAFQKLDFFSVINGPPKYLLEPPKEQLVETYFHPDNMSSAEKMKIELAKVREEFKMSESDCGSARVQVAQLTTKIKHLSSVLHKKDKHSRKGLVAMVQRRKKLLKYMRRTDWDSYCLSLSKLGLRDNPDYKF